MRIGNCSNAIIHYTIACFLHVLRLSGGLPDTEQISQSPVWVTKSPRYEGKCFYPYLSDAFLWGESAKLYFKLHFEN